MALARRATFAALALIGLAGCHAGTNGSLASRSDAPLTRDNITVDRFIATHNRNAAAIRSLKAEPGIEVTAAGERPGRLSGQMAFERSRNFTLALSYGFNTKAANIGSNDREFWFWVTGDKKDNAIYVCDYEHVKETQLAATYQPDWILEAMGLREITEREAATLDARAADPARGEVAGTMILTQRREDSRSPQNMLIKETVFDVESGRIQKHRLYAGTQKKLLAEADVRQYTVTTLAPTEANPEGFKVTIPAVFKLDWKEEKFSMLVTMGNSVQVNPTFTAASRKLLFSEPAIKNANRVDLYQQTLAQAGNTPAASARQYQSMGQPRSGGIVLGQPDPSPMDADPATRNTSMAPPAMPMGPSADVRPSTMDNLGIVRGSQSNGWIGRNAQ